MECKCRNVQGLATEFFIHSSCRLFAYKPPPRNIPYVPPPAPHLHPPTTFPADATQMAQPGLAMSLFEELGLAPIIFAPPERLVPLPPAEGYDWARGAAVARAVARMLEFRLGVTNSQRVAETEWSKMHERGHAEAKMGAGELANAAAGVEVGASEAAPSAAASGEGADGGGDTQVGGKGKGKRKEKAVTEEGNAGEMKAARAGGAVDQKKGGGDPSMLVRELFLCAALLPLAGVKHEVKKGKLVPAAQTVVLESLKVCGVSRHGWKIVAHVLGRHGSMVSRLSWRAGGAVCIARQWRWRCLAWAPPQLSIAVGISHTFGLPADSPP